MDKRKFMPIVSVIMAAFNSERTIDEAIRSILNQDEQDWELIVVDDCSSDRTAELVRAYMVDPRIRLISNRENFGSGHSRNLAIAAAHSPWIAVQDADDVSLPTRLSMQLEAAHNDSAVTVVSCQVAEFGDWGGPEVASWPIDQKTIQSRYDSGKMAVAHCGSLIRTDSIKEVGGYDPDCRRAQDFALFRKMRTPKFVTLPEVLLFYRTERPLPLGYALASGRYGRMARIRTRARSPRPTASVQQFPGSTLTDFRSLVTWGRRRLNERLRER